VIRGLPLLLAASVVSAPHPKPASLAEKGLTQAVAAGRLDPSDAARYRAILGRALPIASTLPPLRTRAIHDVIDDVAAQWRAYTRPRALTLFATLDENVSYLQTHRIPRAGTEAIGADGVLYRWFDGHGLVFHPLGNFALLNNETTGGQLDAAAQLATSLIARAVQIGDSLRWEYEFPFGSGKPPWISGMAQAVAAQALARASVKLGDPTLLDAANSAYRLVPRLVRGLPEGLWVRLYGFSDDVVLNAQLQTILSLQDYAQISGVQDAANLASALQNAAAKLLPAFDTGFWSLYSLKGGESTLGYQDYVISLLKRLGARTGDPLWGDTAARFALYETQLPLIHPGPGGAPIYPDPQDGYKDETKIGFWLSKRSTVTLEVGGRHLTELLGHGYHAFEWSPGLRAPGLYYPRLTAIDPAGNRATAAATPILLKLDATPPEIDVKVAGKRLHWHAQDAGTPWLRLVVRLHQGTTTRILRLGRWPLRGSARLRIPTGRWHAALLASNSTGKIRYVPLGLVPR
jgi:D-glucuronyl C5-epimerase C-terminus